MTDIVLVQPDTYLHDKLRTKPILPLGLLTANCYTAQEYKIKLIDMRLDKRWKHALERELRKKPLCMATGVITGRQILTALEASKMANCYDIPVVWGGHHPSLLPRQTIENPLIDYVIEHEGELTFYELAEALDSNRQLDEKALKKINGLWYKSENRIYANKTRDFIDLNTLPEIPYHIVNINDYLFTSNGMKTLPIETSRGCSNDCSFCHNVPYNHSIWRGLDPDKFINKLNFIKSNFPEVKCIEIIDDHFDICSNRSQQCLKSIKKEKLDFEFYIPGIRITDLVKMKKNHINLLEQHCKNIIAGLESGSQRIQNLLKKDIDIKRVVLINKKMKHFDIHIKYNLVSGFPTETRDDTKDTIRLSQQLIKDNPKSEVGPMNAYRPIPGTKMYGLALKYGLKEPKRLEDWIRYCNWGLKNFDELPWLDEKRRKELKSLLVLSSLFAPQSHTISDNLNKDKLYYYLLKIYSPVLKFRIKYFYFNFMPEVALYQYIREKIDGCCPG